MMLLYMRSAGWGRRNTGWKPVPPAIGIGMLVAFVALMAVALLYSSLAHAGLPSVNWYETATTSGTENSNSLGGGPTTLFALGCCNYDVVNPKVVMLFDAAAVPSNGAIPTRGLLPLGVAVSANQPQCNSLVIAQGGEIFRTGITFAVSTTGRVLTVDTTSGGNVHCAASWSVAQ
jgi:hypothetical protein